MGGAERKASGIQAARVAGIILATATLLTGCGGFGGPSDEDYASLIVMNESELTEVEISGKEDRGSDLVDLTGTAVLEQDLFVEPNEQALGDACGVTAQAVYEVRGPWGGNRNILVLERGPTAGTTAEFVFEIATKQVEVGQVDSDGDVYGPEDVTANGWTWSVFGGSYEIDGVTSTYLGWPADFYGGINDAVFVGSPEFDALCEEFAAAKN